MRRNLLLLLLLIICLFNSAANSLQLYQAGKKAFSVGLYSIALENFDIYLKEDVIDKRVESLYLSGISAYYLKKYRSSLTYFEALKNEYSNSVYVNKSLYWTGLNYFYLEDYNNASIWFLENSEVGSNYKDISLLFNALSNLKLNNREIAKNSFNKIIDDPETKGRYKEEAIYRLATLYLEDNKLNKCINLLNFIILDYPDSKFFNDALSILADSYFSLKEWQSAERAFLLLLEFEDNKKYYKRLATISWNLNKLDESKKYLEYYDANYGEDKDVLFMLGDLYSKEQNISNAILVYRRIENSILLNSQEVKENNYRIGTLFYIDNNFTQAYEYFSLGDSKNSLYFTVLSGLNSDQEVSEFIETLNRKYPGDRLSLDVINRYINYLEENSKNSELEELLIYVTETYTDNISYSLTYGELLLESNRMDESLKYLSKGYKEGSVYYSNIAYKIGWIYYGKGEYSRSIEYFNKINSSDDDYIKALYSKSIANYKMNNLDIGKNGFLELLELNTEYNEEISFYLGLIEKDKYQYEEALKYFNISKNKESLFIDSMDNVAWSYYHLKDYQNALNIYTELWELTGRTIYSFNSANCFLYMENYEEALNLYLTVLKEASTLKSSSYFKSIEILFILERDTDAYRLVKQYNSEFPDSDLPGDVIITEADNRLFLNSIDKAIETYNEVMDIFPLDNYWYKARYRLAECYYLKSEYRRSINNYISSIKDNDLYSENSVKEIKSIMSELVDPLLSKEIKVLLDKNITEKHRVIPIYTECISQGIVGDDPLKDIDELIQISRNRDEINRLIYLKSLTYYNLGDLEQSTQGLKTILSRPEVLDDDKIDSIMLQAQILDDMDLGGQAVELYLKLYINYSDKTTKASYALYKGLLITRKLDDARLEEKIIKIITSEYSDTVWGRRGLGEN